MQKNLNMNTPFLGKSRLVFHSHQWRFSIVLPPQLNLKLSLKVELKKFQLYVVFPIPKKFGGGDCWSVAFY